MSTAPSIRERLDAVRARIVAAARRAGRDPGAVRLVGVVKTVPIERIVEAVGAGLHDLGGNRVQETEPAHARIGGAACWHLIGPLQRNKAGRAAVLFDRIHTVDRWEVAEALSRRAGEAGRAPAVMIQVNVSGEPAKHGVAPDAAAALAERVAGLPALALDGLMAIGTPVPDAEDARPEFARMRALRDAVERATGLRLPELSMGMSGDFEVAVEEGATFVRVGTALFGSRSQEA